MLNKIRRCFSVLSMRIFDTCICVSEQLRDFVITDMYDGRVALIMCSLALSYTGDVICRRLSYPYADLQIQFINHSIV